MVTAKALVEHCREKARHLKGRALHARANYELDGNLVELWKRQDFARQAAELNRAANEAEHRLGGYPFDGRDPGALRLIEMEELLALPGGDYDACDAQYRANCTRAARVLRRELDAICKESKTCQGG